MEAVYTEGDYKGTIQNEKADISMKTRLILTRFGLKFGTLRFDEKSSFFTFLGFAQYWGYKPTTSIHDDSPGVYNSEKNLNSSTIDKTHVKCNVTDGNLLKSLREPILNSSVSNKPFGFKVICEPETIHYRKVNKPVLNTIPFFLQDDDHKEVNSNGQTVTFTFQMIEI